MCSSNSHSAAKLSPTKILAKISTLSLVAVLSLTAGIANAAENPGVNDRSATADSATPTPTNSSETSGDPGTETPVVEPTPSLTPEPTPGSEEDTDGESENTPPAETADPSTEAEVVDEEPAVEETESLETVEPMMAARAQVSCNIPKATFTGSVPASTTQVGAADRYSTAVDIAKRVASRSTGSGRAVFIASGVDFADGLSLGALATQSGWPLLLTRQDVVSAETLNYIKSVNPTHIYIAGGNSAVSDAAVNQIKSVSAGGATVMRFDGSTRYETSAKIAACFPSSSFAFVSTGENFADAIVAASVAAKESAPVILTNTNKLNDYSRAALKSLKPSRVYIVGGKSWDSVDFEASTGLKYNSAIILLSGADRYQTSARVAQNFYGNYPNSLLYATGQNFPDALSGSSLARVTSAPLLLTTRNCRPDSIVSLTDAASRKVRLGGDSVLSENSVSFTCIPTTAARQKIVDTARSMIGVPYLWAGSTPAGFDCSGLVLYSYKSIGMSLPRVARDQGAAGTKTTNPQPGDLIVMLGGAHIGIYIGNGRMIHSPAPGRFVEETVISRGYVADYYATFF